MDINDISLLLKIFRVRVGVMHPLTPTWLQPWCNSSFDSYSHLDAARITMDRYSPGEAGLGKTVA